MKAVRIHEFGGPEVLRYEDVPDPKPRKDQVLVRVQRLRTESSGYLGTQGTARRETAPHSWQRRCWRDCRRSAST